MLKSMLSAVYVDLGATKSVVGIVPKPAFYPLFQAIRCQPEAGVVVMDPNEVLKKTKEPTEHGGHEEFGYGGDGGESNSPSRKGSSRMYYKLSQLLSSRPPVLC